MKNLFEIIFCCIDKNGEILKHANGDEAYYADYIKATNKDEAVKKFELRRLKCEVIKVTEYTEVK